MHSIECPVSSCLYVYYYLRTLKALRFNTLLFHNLIFVVCATVQIVHCDIRHKLLCSMC